MDIHFANLVSVKYSEETLFAALTVVKEVISLRKKTILSIIMHFYKLSTSLKMNDWEKEFLDTTCQIIQ